MGDGSPRATATRDGVRSGTGADQSPPALIGAHPGTHNHVRDRHAAPGAGKRAQPRAVKIWVSTGWARGRDGIGTVEAMLPRMSAALALSLLTLSGCSGGDTPPSTLPTLSTTSSSVPTASAVPSAATANTPQGADAFARYFFDQLNLAFRTSNAELIAALSTDDCTGCATYRQGLVDARAAGEFFNGDTFLVTAVAASPSDVKGTAVDVIGTLPARDSVDGQGRVIKRIGDHGRFHFVLQLRRRTGVWAVVEILRGT